MLLSARKAGKLVPPDLQLVLTNLRVGGNVCETEIIGRVGLLGPGDKVLKVGRTTGITRGRVNGYYLQIWIGGGETQEICIIGDFGKVFADRGDSGACLLLEDEHDGTRSAAGELIGKNLLRDIVFATPLPTILEHARQRIPGLKWLGGED
jgi:hypothetical protein